MKQNTARFLSLLLAAVMLLGVGAFAAPAPAAADPGETATIIVELDEPKAFPLSLFSGAPTRETVKDEIRALVETARVLSADGGAPQKVEFGFDYRTLLQGFSLRAPAGYLDEIRAIDGVRSAFIAAQYHAEPGDWKNIETLAPSGAVEAHDMGYTGKGMVIAVLDTGFDVLHEAFSGEIAAPRLTGAEIDAALPRLHAGEYGTQSAAEVWHSDKLPYCYDYYDCDNTVDGVNHGTHVSGIAAANAGEAPGVAPDAQLLCMKVYNREENTDASVLLAALEDAAVLGADCVNLSLGTEGGTDKYASETQARVYQNLRAQGVVILAAAGNEGSNSLFGFDTPLTCPDGSSVGTPSTLPESLSVANLGVNYFHSCRSGGKTYAVIDAASFAAAPEGLPEFAVLGDEAVPLVPYAAEDPVPEAVRGAAAAIDVRKCWMGYRGICSAAAQAGAKLIILRCDDELWRYETTISAEDVTVPVIFMRSCDAEEILASGTPAVQYDDAKITSYFADGSTSWGPAPGLQIKPEIAGIGHQVYSSVPDEEDPDNHAAYQTMSGTSMSTPQLAGETALLLQYLKEQDVKTPLSLPLLAETLLMNTATPAVDPLNPTGQYLSPLRQGAGLANIADALRARAYLTVSGEARPKAELGEGEGPFTFSFTVHNLTQDALCYRADALALSRVITGDHFEGVSQDYLGRGVDVAFSGTEDGTVRVPAGGETTVTVTITTGDAFRAAVADAVNGVFLDGFVRLHADAQSGSDLGLPYAAFFGDYDDAPLLDHDGIVQKPAVLGSTGQPLGWNLGETCVVTNEWGETTYERYYNPEAASFSPTSAGTVYQSFRSETVLLRAADAVQITVTGPDGTVLDESETRRVGRSFVNRAGTLFVMERFLDRTPDCWAFDNTGAPRPEGEYTLTIRARATEDGPWDEIVHRVYLDPTAPTLDYAVSGEPGSRTLTITVSDNYAFACAGLSAPGAWGIEVSDLLLSDLGVAEHRYDDDPVVRSVTREGETYTMTVDLEAFLQKLAAEGKRTDVLCLNAYDYAQNKSEAIIPISDDVYPVAVRMPEEGITVYVGDSLRIPAALVPADTKHDKLTWMSMDETVATVDENGVVTGVAPGETGVFAIAETPEDAASVMAGVSVWVMDRPDFVRAVRFDANGGTAAETQRYVYLRTDDGAPVGALPEAEREGFTLLGWFTAPEGGAPVTAETLVAEDVTFYAHWAEIAPTEPTGPTEPTEPTAQTTPTVPTVPTEATEPIEPTGPTGPTGPTTPSEPAETTPAPCDGGSGCPSRKFTDVDLGPDSWYHPPLDWAVNAGVVRGMTETTFVPAGLCTRAEIVTMLWRAAGEPESDAACPFTDVKRGAWYEDAVRWAVGEGVTNGMTKTSFAPDKTCRRSEIVTFLWRFIGSPAVTAETAFEDLPDGVWFTDAVRWAAQTNVTEGRSATRFAPDETCERAEAVTFLFHVNELENLASVRPA